MPSVTHELLIEMFRRQPVLAADLLGGALGIKVPTYQQARVDSADAPDLVPTEYRADAVVTLTTADAPVLAVVIEAQLGKDHRKRWSWPAYLATLRARLKCPTILLVVCVEPRIAAWCAAPIDLGHPGWSLAPLVLGPDRVPFVDDVEYVRRAPELAVLSAMAHRDHPELDRVVFALLEGVKTLDDERWSDYADAVFATLGEAAQRYLEAKMTAGVHEYRSDFARRWASRGRAEGRAEGLAEGLAEGRSEGRAEGEAAALLTILEVRGIDVPEYARERIMACHDLEELRVWIESAVTLKSVKELFD